MDGHFSTDTLETIRRSVGFRITAIVLCGLGFATAGSTLVRVTQDWLHGRLMAARQTAGPQTPAAPVPPPVEPRATASVEPPRPVPQHEPVPQRAEPPRTDAAAPVPAVPAPHTSAENSAPASPSPPVAAVAPSTTSPDNLAPASPGLSVTADRTPAPAEAPPVVAAPAPAPVDPVRRADAEPSGTAERPAAPTLVRRGPQSFPPRQVNVGTRNGVEPDSRPASTARSPEVRSAIAARRPERALGPDASAPAQFRAVSAPAGSAPNVKAYRFAPGNGQTDRSGARIIAVQLR